VLSVTLVQDRINNHLPPPAAWNTECFIAIDHYCTRYRLGRSMRLKITESVWSSFSVDLFYLYQADSIVQWHHCHGWSWIRDIWYSCRCHFLFASHRVDRVSFAYVGFEGSMWSPCLRFDVSVLWPADDEVLLEEGSIRWWVHSRFSYLGFRILYSQFLVQVLALCYCRAAGLELLADRTATMWLSWAI